MTTARIRNASSAVAPAEPPLKDDQTPYLMEMIYDGGRWRAYADSPRELMDALVPGYSEIRTPRESAAARIRAALRLQVQLQALLAADEALGQCSPAERVLLLGSREVPPRIGHWSAAVPLVLVTTFYRPAGRLPRPESTNNSVLWIDPASEWSLLVSLHTAGVICLSVRQGSLPPFDDVQER